MLLWCAWSFFPILCVCFKRERERERKREREREREREEEEEEESELFQVMMKKIAQAGYRGLVHGDDNDVSASLPCN